MKTKLNVAIVLLPMIIASSCRKSQSINICIEPDKYTVAISEAVTVSNCGETPPSQIKLARDWGDGTTATDGYTGSH
jgi:hypothetical protein